MRNLLILLAGLLVGLIGCTPKTVKKEPDIFIKKQYPEMRTMVVANENIREEPNGYIIGKLKKGDSVLVLNKSGNWIVYDYYPDEKGYVWAPSLGYSYINLYNPYTYIDSVKQQFKSINYINYIMGQVPDTIQTIGSLSHLEYKNLGLGKRVEEVMEVVKVKKQVVEKTVKVWYDESKKKITEIQIDLYNPVKGKKAALKSAGVNKYFKIFEESKSRIVFQLNRTGKPFYLVLKRKQWKSNEIIGYTVTDKL